MKGAKAVKLLSMQCFKNLDHLYIYNVTNTISKRISSTGFIKAVPLANLPLNQGGAFKTMQ